ncbi:Damage response protein 1 [Spathaspora sp. JA1]|nr:Damage response protein 1 [Spathaspora sp. JA1]
MITTILILLIIVYLARSFYKDHVDNPIDSASSAETQESSVVEGKFTPKTLAKYNGIEDNKVFIAVKNIVYDVTMGKSFYGPGGPYENFAGRDASRGLAKNSFDLEMLTNLDDPIDKLADLNKEELESLNHWEELFESKYKIVGELYENDQVVNGELVTEKN